MDKLVNSNSPRYQINKKIVIINEVNLSSNFEGYEQLINLINDAEIK